MKKRIWSLFLLLFCFLGGCGREISLPQNGGSTEAYENHFLHSFASGQFLESAESYYMIHLDETGGYFIYVLDKEHPKKWLPLCSRPDCSHNSSDCNANISNPVAIGLYNEHLYFCDEDRDSYQLWRMELDGSNHEKVKDLYPYTENIAGNVMIFHKGYLLYELQTVKDGQVTGYELRAAPLDQDKDGYEVIVKADGMVSSGMYPREEMVYLYIRGEEKTKLCTYNLDTKEFSEVEEGVQEPVSITIDKDILTLSLRNKGVYRMNTALKTKEEVMAWEDPEEGVIYTDEDYIYSGKLNRVFAKDKEPGGSMRILDLNGNLIQEAELPEEVLYYTCSTSQHILFHTVTGYEWGLPIYYINKSDIGKGELKFYKIRD